MVKKPKKVKPGYKKKMQREIENIKKRQKRIAKEKVRIRERRNSMLKIGSHVSMSGKKMLFAASEEAVSYGANTFMIYTGAPQNTRRKKIEDLNIEAGRKHMEENGIDEIIVHAPYIINIGNTMNPATFELGVEFLTNRN